MRRGLLRLVREAVARLLREQEAERLGISEVFRWDCPRELVAREDEERVTVVGQTVDVRVLSSLGEVTLDTCRDRARQLVVAEVRCQEELLLCATEVGRDAAGELIAGEVDDVQTFELGESLRDTSRELVASEVELLESLQCTEGSRDATRELVARDMDLTDALQTTEGSGELAREVIEACGEVLELVKVAEGSRKLTRETTAVEGEVLEALQCADLRGERAREALEGEVEVAHLGELTDLAWQFARESLAVGAVSLSGSRVTIPPHAEVVAAVAQVEGIELGELTDGRRKGAGEAREAQAERAELRELIELSRDRPRQLTVVLKLEGTQGGELTDALGELTTELVCTEVEGGDAWSTSDVAHLDTCPSGYGTVAYPVVGVRPFHTIEAIEEVDQGEAIAGDRARRSIRHGSSRSANARVTSELRSIVLLLATAGDSSAEGNECEGGEKCFLHLRVNIK